MAVLQAEIKRGFLRSLARSATKSAVKLSDALAAFQDNGFLALQSGRLLVGSSGGGYSSSFAFPAIGQQFQQDQVFALSEEFLQIYGDVLISLSANGNPSPGDDVILNAMLADDRMQAVKEMQGDYWLLRALTQGTGIR